MFTGAESANINLGVEVIRAKPCEVAFAAFDLELHGAGIIDDEVLVVVGNLNPDGRRLRVRWDECLELRVLDVLHHQPDAERGNETERRKRPVRGDGGESGAHNSQLRRRRDM